MNMRVGGGLGGEGSSPHPPRKVVSPSVSVGWVFFVLNPIINQCLATSLHSYTCVILYTFLAHNLERPVRMSTCRPMRMRQRCAQKCFDSI